MLSSMQIEKDYKLSILDIKILCEQAKFTTTVYRKPSCSDDYINFEFFYLLFINLLWYIL